MFAPAAMAAVSMLSTVASTVVGVMGAMQQGNAAAASANYQAQVARNNAIIAEQNAQRAIQVGNRDSETQYMKTKALIGQQKAAQAASGLDVGGGSAVDVRRSAVELGQLDALTLLNNASAKAAGFRAQKMNFESDAGLYSMQASQAKSASRLNAMGTLIGGASSFSNKWLGYQRQGLMS